MLEYLNASQYDGWGALVAALRTGAPQTGPFAAGGFEAYYADPVASRTFLRAMTSGNQLPATALAACFDWRQRETVIDVGCAEGCLPVQIALAHPHIVGGGFDLPAVASAFNDYVRRFGLAERLRFHSGDFLRDPLPGADVLTMSRILHDWDVATRKLLLRKAYAALGTGGTLIVCETLVDDHRRTAAHALLSSLNMLLQTQSGFESSGAQWSGWMDECGFTRIRIEPLGGSYSAIVGTKP
jgi:precorrin-6B methylase 2